MIVGVAVQKSGTLSLLKSMVGTFFGAGRFVTFGRGPSGPRVATCEEQAVISIKKAIDRVFIPIEYPKKTRFPKVFWFLVE